MNSSPDNPQLPEVVPEPCSYDETLRLIANAPVPAGLQERVRASLLEAAPSRTARAGVLAWRATTGYSALWAGGSWMRVAAAATIVFVVAGGGWGVYRHVEHPVAKVTVMPLAQPTTGGAFSSAGAMRTPQTVKGPVLVQPGTKAAGKNQARKRAPLRRPSAATGAAAPSRSAAAGSK